MNIGELLLGIGLVVTSTLGFWIALPRDRQVRPFLRNDHAQAYYAVSMLAALALGLINIIRGLVP
jgi:hypothetical protein